MQAEVLCKSRVSSLSCKFPQSRHQMGAAARCILYLCIVLECHLDGFAHCCILFAELGRDLSMVGMLHHAQQVMVHQHLQANLSSGKLVTELQGWCPASDTTLSQVLGESDRCRL